MRYAFFSNPSSNHAYFNRLRKSDVLPDFYGIWTHALVYKIINDGFPEKVIQAIHTARKATVHLFIFAGEIDIRFHCADKGKMAAEELAHNYLKVLSIEARKLGLASINVVMPVPPNEYIENENRVNGSFSDRRYQYTKFRDVLLNNTEPSIHIIEFQSITDQIGGLSRQVLAKDLVHLNEYGLDIVRKTLQEKSYGSAN